MVRKKERTLVVVLVTLSILVLLVLLVFYFKQLNLSPKRLNAIKGDVNCDGIVDTKDLQQVVSFVAGASKSVSDCGAKADFNDDKKVDVKDVDYYGSELAGPGEKIGGIAPVFFEPAESCVISEQIGSRIALSAIDIDKDNLADMATTYTHSMMGCWGGSVFSFTSMNNDTKNSPGHWHGRPLQAGDFNNDGFMDLAYNGLYNLSIEINDGITSNRTSHTIFVTNHGIFSGRDTSVGDFNNDGTSDIFALQTALSGGIQTEQVLVNYASGTQQFYFNVTKNLYYPYYDVYASGVGDFLDNDGCKDVAALVQRKKPGLEVGDGVSILLFKNIKEGSVCTGSLSLNLTFNTNDTACGSAADLNIADVNNDGKAEIVVAYCNKLFVYGLNGDGILSSIQSMQLFDTATSATIGEFVLASLNGPEKDAVVGGRGIFRYPNNTLYTADFVVFLDNPGVDGLPFSAPTYLMTPEQAKAAGLTSYPLSAMGVADVNGDAAKDIAFMEGYTANKTWWLKRSIMPGDVNCDGLISFADINPFVVALGGRQQYEARYPWCPHISADVNGDGVVSFADINPFVRLLSG